MLKISKAQLAHLIAVPLTAAATIGAAWLLKHFPGLPHFDSTTIAAGAYGVGLTAAGLALHYAKGLREWQKLEAEGYISTTEDGTVLQKLDTTDPRFVGISPADPRTIPPNQGDAGRAHVAPEVPTEAGQ